MNDRSMARAVLPNASSEELAHLLDAPLNTTASSTSCHRPAGTVIGTLTCFGEAGSTPLVTFHGQPGSAALPAHTVVNLRGADIGRRAVLMFEEGDPRRPIIMGCLKNSGAKTLPPTSGEVVIDSDGDQLVV